MQYLEILFPDRQRRPYYIVAPPYVRTSAGIKVLHQLCHLLNLREQSAFMVTAGVNPDLTTPLLTEEIIEFHFRAGRTPIVVYPEIMHGNPLGAKFVVRYLLNLPGLLGGPSEFPKDDTLLWYSEQYRHEANGKGSVLSIPTTDARFFRPPSIRTKRQGSCFYAFKYKHYTRGPMHPATEKSIEIVNAGKEGGQTQEEIVSLFQQSELFYCYESSALILEAALCECPVIMLPNKHMDKLITCGPFGKAGVAWGTSEEELTHAKHSVGQVRKLYEKFVEQSFTQLDEFIELTQSSAQALGYEKKVQLVNPFIPAPPSKNPLKKGLKRVVPEKTRKAIRKMITQMSK
jgi:hypothetical protein